ncbi:MAG TPA: GNAT family N-acetyltransferase, partial [Ilumatobacteraceae bacterium]
LFGREAGPILPVLLVIAFAVGISIVQDSVQSRRRRRPVVEGELTHLRLMGRRDAPAFAATIDADVVAENRWAPNVRGDFIRAVESGALATTYAICERRTGAIVGAISLTSADKGEADLGLWIGVDNRGRGYASDALTALVRLMRNAEYTSVTASTAETNSVMQSVLRHAGFVEKVRYEHQFPNGEVVPAIKFDHQLDVAERL